MTTWQWLSISFCFMVVLVLYLRLAKKFEDVSKELRQHKEVRTALYEKLADPESIEADFEKSARAREMRDANRTTLPRDESAPHAKVYRPPLRGAKPGGWRPNRIN